MKIKYSKKVMSHFLKPKNLGRLKKPDAVGIAGNPVCGDTMEISIKVKNDRITQIKFQTLGCAVAIAMSSVLTQIAKGKTIEQAKKISHADIIKALGNVPAPKIHCSILAKKALENAIENYKKTKKWKC